MSKLVKYTPANLDIEVAKVRGKQVTIEIPADGGPNEFNHINLAAFTLLKECLFDLRPNEIQFLGGLTRLNSVSIKQRKWLKDLLKRHLGLTVSEPGAEQIAA